MKLCKYSPKPWPTSPPPRPWVTLGLAAFVVEAPFLVTFLLVQFFMQHPQTQNEWWYWPILPGCFPSCPILSPKMTLPQARLVWGAFTACLILLAFKVIWRSIYWRQLLVGGLIISIGLAKMTFLLFSL